LPLAVPNAQAGLRIGIEEGNPSPRFRPADCQVGGQGRFASAAFVLGHGDDLPAH
jgi:hypothetical protein